jgi:hypothetical protein
LVWPFVTYFYWSPIRFCYNMFVSAQSAMKFWAIKSRPIKRRNTHSPTVIAPYTVPQSSPLCPPISRHAAVLRCRIPSLHLALPPCPRIPRCRRATWCDPRRSTSSPPRARRSALIRRRRCRIARSRPGGRLCSTSRLHPLTAQPASSAPPAVRPPAPARPDPTAPDFCPCQVLLHLALFSLCPCDLPPGRYALRPYNLLPQAHAWSSSFLLGA